MKVKAIITAVAALGLFTLVFTGCNPSSDWAKQETLQIQSYMGTIGDTVYTRETSGLYYLDLAVGTGASPVVNDTVYVKYKASFLNNTIIGTNFSDTTHFKWVVSSPYVLPGLDEGVRYMKVGGKAKMLLPSSLAYGAYGYGSIPGYTPLLFVVQLDRIHKGSK
ncbi:MAG TPA: FKBP-type peptidyl-prolyl cis-trans isomerase [Bacteroidales bacterium]|nr:FKBP-type peptidyl-prolyl cis-trans isomerase [Bacteroidales bacterium]